MSSIINYNATTNCITTTNLNNCNSSAALHSHHTTVPRTEGLVDTIHLSALLRSTIANFQINYHFPMNGG